MAVLAIPIALLPKQVGVQVWTAFDALAVVVALALLYRAVAPAHRLAPPVFWLYHALGASGPLLQSGGLGEVWPSGEDFSTACFKEALPERRS